MFLSASYVHTHDIHLPATLESAVQSLNYNFVKSICPQGPAVTATADCVLGQPWTSSAAQTFMASQGDFGRPTCTVLQLILRRPARIYVPYTNFCTEQAAGRLAARAILLFGRPKLLLRIFLSSPITSTLREPIYTTRFR